MKDTVRWSLEKNSSEWNEDSLKLKNKYWWCCSLNHTWQAAWEKIKGGQGCPYCSGKKVLEGFNDLASCRSDVVSLWDFDKNSVL